MSKTTNYIGLTQIEGHEYYNHAKENENLAKIDKELELQHQRTKELEDLIENDLSKATVTLTPKNNVTSVKPKVSGSVGVEIEGALVENLIKNGDFSYGVTGWSAYASSMEINNQVATVTSINTTPAIYSLKYLKRCNIGDKIFAFAKSKILSGNGKLKLRISSSYFTKTPALNQWEELYGIGIMTSEPHIEVQYREGVESGDQYQIDGNAGIIAINMTAAGIEHFTEEQMLLLCRKGYLDGLQPLRGVSVESVGKNLFNGLIKGSIIQGNSYSTINSVHIDVDSQYRRIDIKVQNLKPATSYKISYDYQAIFGNVPVNVYEENNSVYIGGPSFTTIKGGDVILRFYASSVGGAKANYTNIQLEEGTTSTNYEPHQSSEVVYQDPLAKLPNGIADTIDTRTGIKTARTNVGRDGDFKSITGDDFVGIDSSYANVNIFFTDVLITDANNSNRWVTGYEKVNGREASVFSFATWNDNFLTNIFAIGDNDKFYVTFPKAVTTLEEAKTLIDAENLKLVYQLATPQQIQLQQVEPINSYEGYTQFSVSDGVVEGEKANLIYYTTGATYYINWDNSKNPLIEAGSELNYKVNKFNDIKFNGVSILGLGIISSSAAYGLQRWRIEKHIVEANNIDINQIYVDYTTTETCGQPNAKITYSADLSDSITTNLNSINRIGEATDDNSKEIARINEVLEFHPRLLHKDLVSDPNDKHGIRIVNGYVEGMGKINGPIKSDQVLMNTDVYAPKEDASFRVESNGCPAGAVIKIKKNGAWFISISSGTPTDVNLRQIRFKIGG